MVVETCQCVVFRGDAEPEIFAERNVAVAFRKTETPGAAADWLRYHQKLQNAEAAVIVDTVPDDDFADSLAALAPDLPVLVVRLDGALEAAYVGLQCRFLSEAGAVVFLDIADVAVLKAGKTVFDHIRAAPDKLTIFEGVDCYPWRLRQSDVVRHSDHVAVRRKGHQRLTTWGMVPQGLVRNASWTRHGVRDAPRNVIAGRAVYRALGVADPGAATQTQATDLVEAPELVAAIKSVFKTKPHRLPAPTTIPPRPKGQNVAVVSVMKNEGPFILDWIAHNRALGIEHHLVYTNDCDDGTDRLLDLLSDAGVERRDNPFKATGKVPQHAAFKDAEDEAMVQSADWLLTLDVDEYINIHVGKGHLSDLLDAVPNGHLLSMRWRLFGNADHHAFVDRPVTETFTLAAPEIAPQPLQAWAFKTLYRNAGIFRRIGVHRPKGLNTDMTGARWVNGAGCEIHADTWQKCWRDTTPKGGYDLVTLNHYAVRSAESFLVKRERGRANHVENDLGATYWFRMNHNAVKDISIQRRTKATAKEKARLLALPGVAEAHGFAVDWHKGRIATLMANCDDAALYAQITAPRMEKLSRMATKFGPNVHYFGSDLVPDDIADRDPDVDFYFNGTPEIQSKIKELRDARPDPDLFRAR